MFWLWQRNADAIGPRNVGRLQWIGLFIINSPHISCEGMRKRSWAVLSIALRKDMEERIFIERNDKELGQVFHLHR
jgi:hypothetical protein